MKRKRKEVLIYFLRNGRSSQNLHSFSLEKWEKNNYQSEKRVHIVLLLFPPLLKVTPLIF